MDKEQDGLLREAMRRRADKVPGLSAEFQDRVMGRMKTHPGPPCEGGGQPSRRRLRRIGAWMARIAAAVVVGWFVFFGNEGKDGAYVPEEGKETSAAELPTTEPVREEAQEAPATVTERQQPRAVAKADDYPTPAPPLEGAGNGYALADGGASAGKQPTTNQGARRKGREEAMATTAGSGGMADVAAFHAAMDEIERTMAQEVSIATSEALGEAYGTGRPS